MEIATIAITDYRVIIEAFIANTAISITTTVFLAFAIETISLINSTVYINHSATKVTELIIAKIFIINRYLENWDANKFMIGYLRALKSNSIKKELAKLASSYTVKVGLSF